MAPVESHAALLVNMTPSTSLWDCLRRQKAYCRRFTMQDAARSVSFPAKAPLNLVTRRRSHASFVVARQRQQPSPRPHNSGDDRIAMDARVLASQVTWPPRNRCRLDRSSGLVAASSIDAVKRRRVDAAKRRLRRRAPAALPERVAGPAFRICRQRSNRFVAGAINLLWAGRDAPIASEVGKPEDWR
jgi:hypothetical protein